MHPSGVWPRDAGVKMTMEAFVADGGNDGQLPVGVCGLSQVISRGGRT